MELSRYDVYGTRLLVFLEDSPQSNKYRQLIFTPEEFKKVSLSVGTVEGKRGDDELVRLQESEETYELPDLMEHLSEETK